MIFHSFDKITPYQLQIHIPQKEEKISIHFNCKYTYPLEKRHRPLFGIFSHTIYKATQAETHRRIDSVRQQPYPKRIKVPLKYLFLIFFLLGLLFSSLLLLQKNQHREKEDVKKSVFKRLSNVIEVYSELSLKFSKCSKGNFI